MRSVSAKSGILLYVVVMSCVTVSMASLLVKHMSAASGDDGRPAYDVHDVRVKVIGMAPRQRMLANNTAFMCQFGERQIVLATPKKKTSRCPVQLRVGHTYDVDIILYKDLPSILTRVHGEVD